MKVIEIAFTGYPVTDLKRARQFYEGILGLKPTKVFGDENIRAVGGDSGRPGRASRIARDAGRSGRPDHLDGQRRVPGRVRFGREDAR